MSLLYRVVVDFLRVILNTAIISRFRGSQDSKFSDFHTPKFAVVLK